MNKNIVWTGIEYHSLENCHVNDNTEGVAVSSTILGFYQDKIYRVDYTIYLDTHWETKSCLIDFQCNKTRTRYELLRKENMWYLNGVPRQDFIECSDIDIPLTPFTNTLPIKRLNLMVGEERIITVIYLDLLENNVRVVKQKYHRIGDSFYKYENIPNDFEATIEIDQQGFVINYPQLFRRTAII